MIIRRRRFCEMDEASIDLSDCRVLVVDDAAPIRQFIASCLYSAGISKVELAADGVDGLAKMEAFQPDLVVLDIQNAWHGWP